MNIFLVRESGAGPNAFAEGRESHLLLLPNTLVNPGCQTRLAIIKTVVPTPIPAPAAVSVQPGPSGSRIASMVARTSR